MKTLQEKVHGIVPPGSWTLGKLRRVFRVRKGFKNIGMQEDNLLSLSYGRIIEKDLSSAEGLLPESFETYQIVEPGNIIMRLTDLQNDKRSLRQGLVRQRGIITSAYDALEVGSNHDPRYWAYALLALDLAKYYYSLGGGVRQSIKFSDFPNEWLGIPDYATQKAISDFLDHETIRISQLIEKKKNMISLLTQKKAAVINEIFQANEFMVNRPKVKLQRFIVEMCDGPFGSGLKSDHYTSEGIRVIRLQNIGSDFFRSTDSAYIDPEYYATLGDHDVYPGDLLVAGLGDTSNPVGRACVVPADLCPAMVKADCFRLRFDQRRLKHRYLAKYLSSPQGSAEIGQRSKGVTRNRINLEILSQFSIPMPPPEVQDALCDDIDRQIKKIDEVFPKIEHSIVLLHELNTALIVAAVTGQINVLTWDKQRSTDRQITAIEAEMSA